VFTIASHMVFLVVMTLLLIAHFGHEAEDDGDDDKTMYYRRILVWTLPLSVLSSASRGLQRMDSLPKLFAGPVPLLHVIQIVTYSYFREMSGPVFAEIIEGLMLGIVLGTEGVIFFSTYFPELPVAMVPAVVKPVVTVENFAADREHESCTICLDDIRLGELCGRLPCGHIFHACCLDKWVDSHGQAPFCPYRCAAEVKAELPGLDIDEQPIVIEV